MPSPLSTSPLQFKLVLLGETAVGKTSVALRFSRDSFLEYQESTIGAAFLTQSVTLPSSEEVVKFEIWDTAGQERYHSLAPMYYRGAKAALVVYDVTSADSFARAKAWVAELVESGSSDVVLALAGNKCDLTEDREVSIEDAKEYCIAQNIGIFYETSAKNDENVAELFRDIAETLAASAHAKPATETTTRDVANLAQGADASSGTGCASMCA